MKTKHVKPDFDRHALVVKQMVYMSKCLKRQLCAVLVCEHGESLGLGWNGPDEAPGYCPRMDAESEADYHLCETNCPGSRHAEIDALEDAHKVGADTEGGSMYLYGHDHACPVCIAELKHWGIDTLYIVEDS